MGLDSPDRDVRMRNSRMSRRQMLSVAAAASVAGPISFLTARDVLTAQDQATPNSKIPDSANLRGQLGQSARGQKYAVATVSRAATEAALKVFQDGGNAADAAVAAAMMLAVVDGYNSGIGGGCFVLARGADGRMLAIDGRETAPELATPKMFFRNGKADPNLSQTGALASGVPGSVAAYQQLSEELGTGRWKMAVELAADQAEDGFEISAGYAAKLRAEASELARFDGSRKLFFDADGNVLKAGDRLVQNDLANTLRSISTDGKRSFYEGRVAELVDRWMVESGGLLRKDDFSRYRTRLRTPVESQFREHTIFGFPPPSSGGVHVAQILSMLERFDLKAMFESRPADYYHVVAEAMRLAFADRALYLGDPSFAEVPLGLLDPEYLEKRSSQIELERRIPIVAAGAPPGIGRHLFGRLPRHTTHLTTADEAGNWVAITATVNTTFGSKVVIPGTGIIMNNQMDDFAIAPGVANAFGLVGSEANAPAPGKRPLSSMSPTIVMKDGKPVLTCGAAGGPRIITATTQIILGCLGLGMSVEQAIAAPRIHHQWKPDSLYVENELPSETIEKLKQRGHDIDVRGALGTAQALSKVEDGFVAVGEPRLPGVAGAV